MGSEDEFIAATIKAFEPLQLASPELSHKYLKRPPFRFIHDLVSAINARFAAYDHIIPEGMQDADAIDTKEKKIAYLEALIAYLNKLLGKKLDVNPKKIVSGHEVEKTHVFLQALATAVGYAQQDKAANPPPPPPPPAESSDVPPPPPPVDWAAERDAAAQSAGFPQRSSLPKRKSSAAVSLRATGAKEELLKASTDYTQKLKSYALNINIDEPRDIRKEGESMIKMWREMETPVTETTPSQMPAESLELAIQRQIAQLKQIMQLQSENEVVTKKLEDALTS